MYKTILKIYKQKPGLRSMLEPTIYRVTQAKAWAQETRAQTLVCENMPKPGLNKNRYKKGFGLMEVLISAVIIIIILSALVTIGRMALSNSEYLAERAQAIYLAQEGLEMTRQIRDTNWIDGNSDTKWNTLYSSTNTCVPTADNPCNYSITYVPDVADLTLGRIQLTSAAPGFKTIPINSVNFKQQIRIASITGFSQSQLLPSPGTDLKPYAIKVTSTVTWNFSGQNKSVNVSEFLTNWRPDF